MPIISFSIGELADKAACNVPTIRYYEQIGLIPAALRTAGGPRYYGKSDLLRLQFVKRCRDFGFPIEEVRKLVATLDDGDGNCGGVRDIAKVQLLAVQSHLVKLRALEAGLAAFVANCEDSCVGDANRDCCIISDLAARSTSNTTCEVARETTAREIGMTATQIRRHVR